VSVSAEEAAELCDASARPTSTRRCALGEILVGAAERAYVGLSDAGTVPWTVGAPA